MGVRPAAALADHRLRWRIIKVVIKQPVSRPSVIRLQLRLIDLLPQKTKTSYIAPAACYHSASLSRSE